MPNSTTDRPTIDDVQSVLEALNHCRVLNLSVTSIADGQLTIALPYSEHIVGNPETGVIHGGALTTLLDSTCGLSLLVALQELVIAPTLDLRIDYMTSAQPHKTIYARAGVFRNTRNILFCRGIAYQDDRNKPIAHCVATFMRLDKDIIENPLPELYSE